MAIWSPFSNKGGTGWANGIPIFAKIGPLECRVEAQNPREFRAMLPTELTLNDRLSACGLKPA